MLGVVDGEKLCGILVVIESSPSKVRVADLANLKPQTENHAMDMGNSRSTIEHGSVTMLCLSDMVVMLSLREGRRYVWF